MCKTVSLKKLGLAKARPNFESYYLAAFFFFAVERLRVRFLAVVFFTAFFFLAAVLRGFAFVALLAFLLVALLAFAMTFFPFYC